MKSHQDEGWLRARHAEGRSQREIAALAGVSPVVIRAAFRKFGIQARTISEALTLKPSRHEWTEAERAAHAARMREVQAGRKEELSASAKLNWQENREAIVAGIREAAQDPERNRKCREALECWWAKDENRQKMSAIAKTLWADSAYRRLVISATTAACGTDDFRNKVKERFQDEGYKAQAVARLLDPATRCKARAAMLATGFVSRPQRLLYDHLHELDVAFCPEGPQTLIGHWSFDCLVPKTATMHRHLLIEVQGDWFHRQPKRQAMDRSKFTYVERYFPDHEIMYVWEHEFYAKERVLDRLKLKLGLKLETVDFQIAAVTVRPVAHEVAGNFLAKYHYLIGSRSGLSVGAFLDDVLIGVATFSTPVRQNLAKYGRFRELSRFCIHPLYHKRNLASRFLKLALKHVTDVDSVVSYADSTVGHLGTVYKAAGFAKVAESEPEYWYVDEGGHVMSKKKVYSLAKSMKVTEAAMAESIGFVKRWGGKKLCFQKSLRRSRSRSGTSAASRT